jgi:hypothetical protein
MLRFQQPLRMLGEHRPILFFHYWYYLRILISSSWYPHQRPYFIVSICLSQLRGCGFFGHNLDTPRSGVGDFWFLASYFGLQQEFLKNLKKFERFFVKLMILALKTADLGNKKIDLIVFSSYFWLELTISFLKLIVLSRFSFAHNSTFLIKSLYLAA